MEHTIRLQTHHGRIIYSRGVKTKILEFFLQDKNPESLGPHQGWILRTLCPFKNQSGKQVLAGILICSIKNVNMEPSLVKIHSVHLLVQDKQAAGRLN